MSEQPVHDSAEDTEETENVEEPVEAPEDTVDADEVDPLVVDPATQLDVAARP